ncbi:MAG: PEP-CTERM sorting domain-containing protein, partial [Planctomycetota bacterium]|nr:PEP-CTERM sorting domain-containing protein [Planctomycetota bacterium]
PKTVLIMENTTAVDKYGGIWGRFNRDRGIRFNNDNPAEGSIYGSPAVVGSNLYANLGPVVAGGTHQLINGVSTTVDAIAYNPADPYSLNPYTPYRKTSTSSFNDFGINDQGTNQGGTYAENYYWSDTTVIDGRQTWQNKNWGTLGAYAYDLYAGPTYPSSGDRAIALGAYNGASRGWAGGIGEVLIYDRWLSDAERQSVESYLADKWLVTPEPATLSLLALGAMTMRRRRRGL